MNEQFRPAMAAMQRDDLEGLREFIRQDPALATSRSSTSHPTLLQCLVLSGKKLTRQRAMAQVLIEAGAELNGPLVACGSCDNAEAAGLLLDCGAAMDGTGGWCPLEEALYWNSGQVVNLLLERGAAVSNLRIAAGLGRIDLIEGFFYPDGTLKPEAGKINWPWGDLSVIEKSNFDPKGRKLLADKFSSWKNDRQAIINNAFVYSCMHGHLDAAQWLLNKGAELNTIPGGFDFAGTGLHYAALNGHRPMVDFLLRRGADVTIKDEKVGGSPAEWAEYAHHSELASYLKSIETK